MLSANTNANILPIKMRGILSLGHINSRWESTNTL